MDEKLIQELRELAHIEGQMTAAQLKRIHNLHLQAIFAGIDSRTWDRPAVTFNED